jgi:hypothetical protein
MGNLIAAKGQIIYGLYDEPVDCVNYLDYPLETTMGMRVPGFLKRYLANQFHFAGIIGPEIMMGMAVVDLKYLANGFLYVYDRQTRELIEAKKLSLPHANIYIEPYPQRPNSVFLSDDLNIEIRAGKIHAVAQEIQIDVTMNIRDIKPLRLCTRAGYRGWVYMQKTTPIPISGQVRYKGKTIDVASPAYRALMDWTTGYMRRDTYWNWAATATTLADGKAFGLNLSCGVNETSFTENAFWIGEDMTKVDTVHFAFNNHNLYENWHITSFDKKVDLVFYPEAHRGELVNACFIKSRFTQLMGTFEGRLKTDQGSIVEISACPGWAEDHYAKW